ncbi:hypothetical protein [Legionella donaldsonii]|nr:hypothetical protein [Legionella donaldsonii]
MMPGLEKIKNEETSVDREQEDIHGLKRRTKQQLDLLKKQTERLELFKPDIDLVMQWYEIKSSQFSKLAYYYGQQSWYQRQILHGEVIAGAVVLGFAVHALAFFVLIAAYYKGASLLADHYAIEETNKEAMKQSLAKLGEGLEQSIKSFNEMETKLDKAFTAMEEQNEQLSSSISDLNKQALTLHAQLILLEETVKNLQEQQKRVLSTTDKMESSGDRLGKEIDSLSSLILERKSALDLVTATIDSVLRESVTIKKEVSQAVSAIQEEGLTSKVQIEKCDRLQLKVHDHLLKSQSIGNKMDEQLKTSDFILTVMEESSNDEDEILLRAQRALSKSTAQRQLVAKEEVAPSTVVFR